MPSLNKLEQRVATMLDAAGVAYIPQYRVGRFVFDFYLPATHTLLEVHGTFWHADPRVYYHGRLTQVQRRTVANDARKTAYALRQGYHLAILWEADVPRA
jgi:G:T-mismatch repair DNA endonuclease (very short patch repair protein)